MLRAAGLAADSGLIVISAATVSGSLDAKSLREGASVIRVAARREEGLAALRHEDVVGVVPVPMRGLRELVADLERARLQLHRRHVDLVIGPSTRHFGLDGTDWTGSPSAPAATFDG